MLLYLLWSPCDFIVTWLFCDHCYTFCDSCDLSHDIFPCFTLVIKEKKRKEILNNNLAILLSHDRDLINKGKVAAFVNNVLVGTETEKGHDEIIEEVLKRLEENNLYVKLKKCMWKVRKIGFLGVIIEPNGIEIEKEKVDSVLSWLEPKNVKDVRKFLGLAKLL